MTFYRIRFILFLPARGAKAEIVFIYRPSLPDPDNAGVGKRMIGYDWQTVSLFYLPVFYSVCMIAAKAFPDGRGFFIFNREDGGIALSSGERSRTMEASVAIQCLPAAPDDDELCRIVDEVIDYIRSTGYNYYVGPFETTIEGPYDALMDIVKECQHIAIRAGAQSVAAYIKVSYKPEGDVLSIDKKIGKYH